MIDEIKIAQLQEEYEKTHMHLLQTNMNVLKIIEALQKQKEQIDILIKDVELLKTSVIK
jgi:hypothetical protein